MEPEKEKAAMKRKKYKKQCNFYLFSLCQVFKGFNDFDYFFVFYASQQSSIISAKI